jgi:putative Mg2+ transporter-C (MgtC) family protein
LEIDYGFELVCRPEGQAHMRALMLQGIAGTALALTALRSEDNEGTDRVKVTARIRGMG